MLQSDKYSVSTTLGVPHNEKLLYNQDRCIQSRPENLLDLNDDCLLEILQYLSVQETFSLIGIFDSRFDDIAYKRIAKMRYLKFSQREPPTFTPSQLEIIGRHLQYLNISVGYSLDSESCFTLYLRPLCHFGAIRSVTLHYVRFNEDSQKCILNVAPSLKFLDLSFCELTDDLLRPILEKSLQLKTLVVVGNYDLKGKSLHSINSEHIDSVTVELNDLGSDEVLSFIGANSRICVTVYEKFRRSHARYHQGKVTAYS